MSKSLDNLIYLQNETSEKRPKRPKTPYIDPAVERSRMAKMQARHFIKGALDISIKSQCKAVFIYVDALNLEILPDKFPPQLKVILVSKDSEFTADQVDNKIESVIHVPNLKLGRMGLVKLSVLLAMSEGLVNPEDRITFLIGKARNKLLDTILTFRIDEETEILSGTSFDEIPQAILPGVFEQALGLAIELGNQGKEGKPIGTIFVVGDEERVMQLSRQMIINPFKGYEPEERNLLNPELKETLRELSSIDGAFVIAGNGEILAAGRYLGASSEDAEITKGLGSRHLAAAGITALTNAIAIVISETSGDVRIFRNGGIMMEIEKPHL